MDSGDTTRAFYEHIYAPLLRLDPRSVLLAKRGLSRDLVAAGVEPSQMAEVTFAEVGTGRQTAALLELGARHVTHIDLGSAAVSELDNAAAAHNARVTHVIGDLCDPRIVLPEVDVFILNGVIQHLPNPVRALNTVCDASRHLLLRTYRSGACHWYLTEHLRQIVSAEPALHASELEQVFEPSDPEWFRRDIADDLFVPILRLYAHESIRDFLIDRGGAVYNPQLDTGISTLFVWRKSPGPHKVRMGGSLKPVKQQGLKTRPVEDAQHHVYRRLVAKLMRRDATTRLGAVVSAYKIMWRSDLLAPELAKRVAASLEESIRGA